MTFEWGAMKHSWGLQQVVCRTGCPEPLIYQHVEFAHRAKPFKKEHYYRSELSRGGRKGLTAGLLIAVAGIALHASAADPKANFSYETRQFMKGYGTLSLVTGSAIGALSGKHEIGGKAWYPRGAEWLVNQQAKSGAWFDPTCMRPQDTLATCFALLFLKKATMPTVTVSHR